MNTENIQSEKYDENPHRGDNPPTALSNGTDIDAHPCNNINHMMSLLEEEMDNIQELITTLRGKLDEVRFVNPQKDDDKEREMPVGLTTFGERGFGLHNRLLYLRHELYQLYNEIQV